MPVCITKNGIRCLASTESSIILRPNRDYGEKRKNEYLRVTYSRRRGIIKQKERSDHMKYLSMMWKMHPIMSIWLVICIVLLFFSFKAAGSLFVIGGIVMLAGKPIGRLMSRPVYRRKK